ncbi:Transposase for IS3511a [Corynebacterium pseudotuberculosis]|nr:Transposase for IS3511a [Corynebacterium pseudotuberculosis PAT10]ARS60477.1 Transposase for IS3511a [Corynebacterium pseudotuberculosis]
MPNVSRHTSALSVPTMAKKHTFNKVIIDTIHATGITHTQAAEMFGVSTRWIRELLHRYNTGGYQALEPQSRCPHTSPRAITDDIIDSAGKVSLRWAGESEKLYIGTRYAGMPIILVCLNNKITAVNPETTEILGRYLLEKGRSYHRNLLKDPHQPNPDKKKSLETSNRNDVSRLHRKAPSGT